MTSLHCGVRLSEAELVVRYPVLLMHAFIDLLISSFSRTFEIMGSKLIGLYDESSVGSFPGLGIVMICARFKDVGQ